MPDFQYDPRKSSSNQRKHGIDFEQAKLLWEDAGLVVVATRSDDEPRSLVIGKINDQHWSAIVTDRDGEIRIISVRRSRLLEIELYEG